MEAWFSLPERSRSRRLPAPCEKPGHRLAPPSSQALGLPDHERFFDHQRELKLRTGKWKVTRDRNGISSWGKSPSKIMYTMQATIACDAPTIGSPQVAVITWPSGLPFRR